MRHLLGGSGSIPKCNILGSVPCQERESRKAANSDLEGAPDMILSGREGHCLSLTRRERKRGGKGWGKEDWNLPDPVEMCTVRQWERERIFTLMTRGQKLRRWPVLSLRRGSCSYRMSTWHVRKYYTDGETSVYILNTTFINKHIKICSSPGQSSPGPGRRFP